MEQKYTTIRDSKACRTCLVEIGDSSCVYLYGDQFSTIRNKLKELIPDMNLFLTPSPVICGTCYEMVESAYQFKQKCLEIEKFIYLYIEEHSGTVVNLTELNQFNSKCLENYSNDCENTSDTKTYIDDVSDNIIIETCKDENSCELEYQELYVEDHYTETNEIIDINNLMVNNDLENSDDMPDSNIIVVSSGDEDDNEISEFFKRTPYSCGQCTYRTAYRQNLMTHISDMHKCH